MFVTGAFNLALYLHDLYSNNMKEENLDIAYMLWFRRDGAIDHQKIYVLKENHMLGKIYVSSQCI